ncbi:MAG: serine hydrolase [Candidatus Paceibacterota bacterium]|jgi:hypothetical protein
MDDLNKNAFWVGIFFIFLAALGVIFGGTASPSSNNRQAQSEPVLADITWTMATSSAPWETRDAGATYQLGDKLFLAGGLNGNKTVDNKYVQYWEAKHFNDIWSTTDGLNWAQEKSAANWQPRRSLSVVYFKDKLLMMGGWSNIEGYQNDVWSSTDGINWTQISKEAAWPKREGQVVRVFNNKLWLIGGVNFDERRTFNDVWYSENGTDWLEATGDAPWASRYDHDVVVFNNKLWVMGGLKLDGATPPNDVWSTTDGINWTLENANAPWGPRHGLIVLDYKNNLWVIGGWDLVKDTGSQTMWFSDNGKDWQKTTTDIPWMGREDHAAEIFKDKIWMMGGMGADWQWHNDVWYTELNNNEKSLKEKKQTPDSSLGAAVETSEKLSAKEYKVVSLNKDGTKEIISSKNPQTKRPIASITKLMSAMVVLDSYSQDKEVVVSKTDEKHNGPYEFLYEGEVFSVGELIKMVLVESNNDAMSTLASIAGEQNFVNAMNLKAKELGLSSTKFSNPTGLDNSAPNESTADDLINLAVYIQKNYPKIFEVTTTRSLPIYTASGSFHHLAKNTDQLLDDKDLGNLIVGGKTGETPLAEKNLLLLTNKNEKTYISVVLGSQDHFKDTKKILNEAFAGN